MRRTCDIDGMSSSRGGIFINVNKTSDNRATLIRRRLVRSGRSCVVSAFGVNGRTSQFDAAEIAREINCISTADRLEYMHGNRSPRCLGYTASQDHQRRFRAGAEGHRPLQIVATPPQKKISRTLDTLWSTASQKKKLVNLMPRDVRVQG